MMLFAGWIESLRSFRASWHKDGVDRCADTSLVSFTVAIGKIVNNADVRLYIVIPRHERALRLINLIFSG